MANASLPNQFEAGSLGSDEPVGVHGETHYSGLPGLESTSANEDDQPRLSHPASPAAAHFVNRIHDGIEYSLTQLGHEISDLLKRAVALDEDEFRDLASALHTAPPQTPVRDDAVRWTAFAASELGIPTPTIAASVGMRTLSELEKQNEFATTPFRQPMGRFGDDAHSVFAELQGALSAATIITYAQGMAVLIEGSNRYQFGIDLLEVIHLWKKCADHRSTLLDEIASAIQAIPNLRNLLDDDDLSEKVMDRQECLRHAVWRAGLLQTSVPALLASLDYLDTFRGAWLPINLIQAHR